MRKYTEKIHAQQVQKIYEKKDPCVCCPAQRKLTTHDLTPNALGVVTGFIFEGGRDVCRICRSFVGIPHGCPCQRLGEKEAKKRTWIALEEKGYLE